MYPATCLICGAAAFEQVQTYDSPDQYELAASVSPADYRREWVRCCDCGFHYSRYTRDAETFDRLYEQGYRKRAAEWRSETTEEAFRRFVALPDDQSEARLRIAWIKDRLGRHRTNWTAPPYRMLDVGGASGVFAWLFQDQDWRAHVIDPSGEADFISDVLQIPLVTRPYTPDCFTEKFHLATAVFVLEHLVYPDKALAGIRQDLLPDGLLYVEVPDALAFERKLPDDDIFNATHLWMFDPPNLGALLDRNGFEVLELEQSETVREHLVLTCLAGRTSCAGHRRNAGQSASTARQ